MSHGGPLRIKSLSILTWRAGLKQRRSREAVSAMLGDNWEEAKKKKPAGCSNKTCRGHRECRKQRGKRSLFIGSSEQVRHDNISQVIWYYILTEVRLNLMATHQMIHT